MDDLELRRRIMSDPKNKESDSSLTKEQCEFNSKFIDDILKLDNQIEQAMKVDVPDGLADRILFNQSAEIEETPFTRSVMKRTMAMAASIAFAAGLLVGQINWAPLIVSPAHASLADTAMQHVVDESPFTNPLDEKVSSKQINMKLKPFDFSFSDNFPYHVYYLNHCGFGSSNAMHMVFQGEKGRVTMFVTRVDSDATQSFQKNGMSGTITPLKGASMVLVGEADEDVAKIAEALAPIIKPIG